VYFWGLQYEQVKSAAQKWWLLAFTKIEAKSRVALVDHLILFAPYRSKCAASITSH
jgi:hypothetical protein